jgi:DNA-binding NtrC family response regulator
MTREKMPKPIVLVVDDEALIRWSIAERLGEDGFAVRQAGSGSEALTVLSALADVPLVVVLDLRLPDVTNLSLFRQIRWRRPDAPVILMTAHGTPADERDALAEGAFRFVGKPFDVADIARLVADACGRVDPE